MPFENLPFAEQIHSLLLRDFLAEWDHWVIEKQVPVLLREHPWTQLFSFSSSICFLRKSCWDFAGLVLKLICLFFH